MFDSLNIVMLWYANDVYDSVFLYAYDWDWWAVGSCYTCDVIIN